MYPPIQTLLQNQGVPPEFISPASTTIAIMAIMILAVISYWIAKYFIVPLLEKAMMKTKYKWDDVFVHRKLFPFLARLVPIVFIYVAADLFFAEQPATSEIIKRIALTLLVLTTVRILDAALLITEDIYSFHKMAKERPIGAYLSIIKIVFYIFACILTIAILTNKSPLGILSVLGGLTAVLLLIFKDTILGFVASIQLLNLKMVRVGDWIEMPKYGADGDVIDVTIHTVKVQNWDKTITTIPTYAMVSNSFKNWRGMSESGGRRIKRAISIDMNSIKFCTDEMLEKLSQFSILEDYPKKKQEEITTHNQKFNFDSSMVSNGRRQTNIGIFRTYIKAYLRNNPKIHKNMTFLVRQLTPTSTGLPLEIYVFSNDQAWANYEDIQADIFDHILAVLPEFGLRVFQEPAGYDFRKLNKHIEE